MMGEGASKPLYWVGSSRDDLKGFPDKVQDHIGFALYQAQIGLKHRDAKPMAGIAPGLMEVISRSSDGTYRAVYTVAFAAALYVLHAFQKKSKRGTTTPRLEIELIRQRLKLAMRYHAAAYEKGER